MWYKAIGNAQFPADRHVDAPTFERDVWPFLQKTAGDVWVFYNEAFGRRKRLLEVLDMRCLNFANVGHIDALNRKELAELRDLSYHGGHMNVFYEFSVEEIVAFIMTWPYAPHRKGFDTLPLTPAERDQLGCFVKLIVESRVYVACGHDGDPIFMFGNERDLLLIDRKEEAELG